METRTYCVYNQTTESFLSVGASVVDTIVEPWKAVKMLVDAEELNVESGLWLTPYRGIPLSRIFSPVDLVYLDESNRVVHVEGLIPGIELVPFAGHATSALILPSQTAQASRTQTGHQLIICFAEELVRHLARVPLSAAPPRQPQIEPAAEQIRANEHVAPPTSSNRSRRQPAASQQLGDKAPAKSRTPEQEPVKSRYQPLTGELVRHLAETPDSVAPPPPAREQSIARPVDESEPDALQPEELESVVSPVVLPEQGVGDPLTPVRMATPPLPPVPPRVEAPPPQLRAADPAPIQPVNRVRRAEIPAPQPSNKRVRLEIQPDEISSVVSQVLNWARDPQLPPVRTSIPTPAPVPPGPESRAEQLRVSASAPPPPFVDRTRQKPPAAQRPAETTKVESRTREERPSTPDVVYRIDTPARPAAPVSPPIAPVLRPTMQAPVSPVRIPAPIASVPAPPASVPISAAPVVRPTPSAPIGRSIEPKAEPPRVRESVAPAQPTDRPLQKQVAPQRPDTKEKPRPHATGASPAKNRFKRWADDVTAPLARGSSPTTPEHDSEETESASRKKESLQNRFMQWLYPENDNRPIERRRAKRRLQPGLIAYYYTGGPPEPQKIGNISATGFYMLTKERWLPDTMMRMTLQRTGTQGENPEDSLTVFSRIVRWGEDGVGTEFIMAEASERNRGRHVQVNATDPEALQRFL